MRPVLACLCVWLALAGAMPASAADLSVEGTGFVLHQDGRTFKSQELMSAEIELGGGHWLRIDAVRTDPADPDILLHSFSTRDARSGWHNPCTVDRNGKQEGFPLPGRWDDAGRFHVNSDFIAITCTDGAQAKCVRFGYKPWKTSSDGRSLVPLYEACVRMVRADYCGDGATATSDGTPVEIFDGHGVWQPDRLPGFVFEAGWTHAGAVCVRHTRIAKNLGLDELVKRCPRLASAVGDICDEQEARRRGAVLFNASR
ncbi:ADYC domain-containing protein [Luteimonas sp. SX5]|uniref:ADYC domain-containing protein n=1 Tax=Luteimonas galliterrae TaxID=2940486 RepID=A0ABT0MEP4_9GAMM|nr:ADYC domain-containing protein [Luteimonas galliterrae]MCL1633346.1 ADYC domain-containing protein [Luteimonas galliterrae]